MMLTLVTGVSLLVTIVVTRASGVGSLGYSTYLLSFRFVNDCHFRPVALFLLFLFFGEGYFFKTIYIHIPSSNSTTQKGASFSPCPMASRARSGKPGAEVQQQWSWLQKSALQAPGQPAGARPCFCLCP